jgi:hypothetical protein
MPRRPWRLARVVDLVRTKLRISLGDSGSAVAEKFANRCYGICSVVGFVGPLRRSDLYAVLLFSKVPVDRQAASQLRRLALDVTTRLFQFGDDAVFDSPFVPE